MRKCKVVMLPTNQKAVKGCLLLGTHNNRMFIHTGSVVDILGGYNKPQHLYIISDDVVKDGNYCFLDLADESRIVKVISLDSNHPVFTVDIGDGYAQLSSLKKVIATTDESLTIGEELFSTIDDWENKKGFKVTLPKPSQSFIDVFIREYNKGNIINDIMVEYEGIEWLDKPLMYFPKINPKDNTITIKRVKDSWSREEHEKAIKEAIYEAISFPEKFVTDVICDNTKINNWITNNNFL